MELEIVLLLVELTAIILTASTHVQLLIKKDAAVMEKKLEWCAKVKKIFGNSSFFPSQ